jgi:hypothetical protein
MHQKEEDMQLNLDTIRQLEEVVSNYHQEWEARDFDYVVVTVGHSDELQKTEREDGPWADNYMGPEYKSASFSKGGWNYWTYWDQIVDDMQDILWASLGKSITDPPTDEESEDIDRVIQDYLPASDSKMVF